STSAFGRRVISCEAGARRTSSLSVSDCLYAWRTLPSTVATATASYPSLTLSRGQRTGSTTSSGLTPSPAAARAGPTPPPPPATLWQVRQANLVEAKTPAPRSGSPCDRASARIAATVAGSPGAASALAAGGGGTGVRGFGFGPTGRPSSWATSQS